MRETYDMDRIPEQKVTVEKFFLDLATPTGEWISGSAIQIKKADSITPPYCGSILSDTYEPPAPKKYFPGKPRWKIGSPEMEAERQKTKSKPDTEIGQTMQKNSSRYSPGEIKKSFGSSSSTSREAETGCKIGE